LLTDVCSDVLVVQDAEDLDFNPGNTGLAGDYCWVGESKSRGIGCFFPTARVDSPGLGIRSFNLRGWQQQLTLGLEYP